MNTTDEQLNDLEKVKSIISSANQHNINLNLSTQDKDGNYPLLKSILKEFPEIIN